MAVVTVENDEIFQQQMSNAGMKVVVVDWFADCPSAVFLKANVEKCINSAAAAGVQSLPTFQFYKNRNKIFEFSGADQEKLRSSVAKYASIEDDGEGEEFPPGQLPLKNVIDFPHFSCLNQSDDSKAGKGLFSNNADGAVESDCDEQLLFHIPFQQPIKLHSIAFKGPADGRAPKTVKLYMNQNAMDFGSTESLNSVQDVELSEEDVAEGKWIPLRYVKFQNVHSLQVFVENNQGDEETTVVQALRLLGQPKDFTNMQEFKRVAGEVGEAHG